MVTECNEGKGMVPNDAERLPSRPPAKVDNTVLAVFSWKAVADYPHENRQMKEPPCLGESHDTWSAIWAEYPTERVDGADDSLEDGEAGEDENYLKFDTWEDSEDAIPRSKYIDAVTRMKPEDAEWEYKEKSEVEWS